MAQFRDSENGYKFVDEEGYEIEMNQDNYWVWLNREQPLLDMAQLQDERDGLSWPWFRLDVGDETFNQLDMMARKVGTVVLRETVTEDVQTVFDKRHAFDNIDDAWDELEGLDE